MSLLLLLLPFPCRVREVNIEGAFVFQKVDDCVSWEAPRCLRVANGPVIGSQQSYLQRSYLCNTAFPISKQDFLAVWSCRIIWTKAGFGHFHL